MSIGSADSQIVEEVVEDWVDDEKMFTAFDVSVEAKKRGAQCRHREMKSTIHELMRYNSNYRKQTLQVRGAYTKPFVYLPHGSDISEYEPMDRSKFDDADTSAKSTPKVAKTSVSGQLDKRGRYCIRSSFVADAGFDKGERVSVFINSDEIQIVPTSVTLSAQISKTYKVDKDRNIRLSKKLLSKAFGDKFVQIKCEVDGDKIVVESK